MSERIELEYRLKEALEIRGKKAADISKDLKIPKSAISQYLDGTTKKMDSRRLEAIAKFLDISEPWLLGYDVPMERQNEKKNDTISDIVVKMRKEPEFFEVMEFIYNLDDKKFRALRHMLSAFME